MFPLVYVQLITLSIRIVEHMIYLILILNICGVEKNPRHWKLRCVCNRFHNSKISRSMIYEYKSIIQS